MPLVNTNVVLPNRLLDFVNPRLAAPVGASRAMSDAIVERLLAGTP
jgi:hypothetical protein